MTRAQLSVNDKIWIIKNMYRLEYPILVQRKWSQEMADESPNRPTVNSLINKFEQTGSVNNMSPPGPPVIVTGKVIQEQASLILDSHPQTSIPRTSSHLGISMTSVRHIYNALEFNPYISRVIHKLNEDDFDPRVAFWETLISIIANEPDFIKHVIWSDEATFKVNGMINRHNSVYWRKENPHIEGWQNSHKQNLRILSLSLYCFPITILLKILLSQQNFVRILISHQNFVSYRHHNRHLPWSRNQNSA